MKLNELVEALKAELRESASTDPMFVLKSVRITTKVVARESTSGRAGIEFLVFKLGADATVGEESVQEVTIELAPIDRELSLGP